MLTGEMICLTRVRTISVLSIFRRGAKRLTSQNSQFSVCAIAKALRPVNFTPLSNDSLSSFPQAACWMSFPPCGIVSVAGPLWRTSCGQANADGVYSSQFSEIVSNRWSDRFHRPLGNPLPLRVGLHSGSSRFYRPISKYPLLRAVKKRKTRQEKPPTPKKFSSPRFPPQLFFYMSQL